MIENIIYLKKRNHIGRIANGSGDNHDKIVLISQKKEAVSLLIYATKVKGVLYVVQDISCSNPYVEIGAIILPDNDDARSSATWIGAVKVLEENRMLECVNYEDKEYKLMEDGWNNEKIYIEQNWISEEEMRGPKALIDTLMD